MLRRRTIESIVLVFVLVLFFWISIQYIGNDEGSYGYEAKLILEGKHPIQDFITRAPPLTYLLAFLFRIFGASLLITKILNALLFALTGFLTYRLIKVWKSHETALCGALAVLLHPVFFLSRLSLNTTGLSVVFALAACGWVRRENKKKWIYAGILFALAFLTRESYLIFFLLMLTYCVLNRRTEKAKKIFYGFSITLILVAIFFCTQMNPHRFIDGFLGVGHLIIQEKMRPDNYHSRVGLFFLLSLLPFLFGLAVVRPVKTKLVRFYPEIIFLLSNMFFYIYFATRRGFLLSYGSEFIPFICILFFSLISSKRVLWVAVAPLFLFLTINFSEAHHVLPQNFFSLGELAGSSTPRVKFAEVLNAVKKYSLSGDTVLAGNLAYVLESGRNSFASITRPMAYERDKDIYKIYEAPTPEELAEAFDAYPPQIIVLDEHLSLSIWPVIRTHLGSLYSKVYSNQYAQVYSKLR